MEDIAEKGEKCLFLFSVSLKKYYDFCLMLTYMAKVHGVLGIF